MSIDNFKSYIVKNIRKLRQAKGLSQDKLSKLADLSLNPVVNIEAGNNPHSTIEMLEKIGKAFGVSVEELIKR